MEKRNALIDNLKVLLIFVVVLGHVIEYYIQDSIILRGLYILIYFFHMPLFVFVSGYLCKDVEKCSKNVIKGLLIPYIVFNIIWYTLAYFATGELMWLIIYPGWTLWYLLSLFFWRVSLKYITRCKFNLVLSICAGLLIGLLPRGGVVLSLSRTISFLPFFLLGHYTSESQLLKVYKMRKGFATIGVMCAALLAFYLAKNNFLDYSFFYHSDSYKSSGIGIFEGLAFRLLLYVGATILSMCVLRLIPQKETVVTAIGKATMSIYLFHPYLTICVYGIVNVLQLISDKIPTKIILIISPALIVYVLSRKMAIKAYDGMFKPIHKVVYSKRIWGPCKKQYTKVKPKVIRVRRKLLAWLHI